MKLAVTEIIYIVVVLALIFWGIPALIKYFIRYGIDYYLSKTRDANRAENKEKQQ